MENIKTALLCVISSRPPPTYSNLSFTSCLNLGPLVTAGSHLAVGTRGAALCMPSPRRCWLPEPEVRIPCLSGVGIGAVLLRGNFYPRPWCREAISLVAATRRRTGGGRTRRRRQSPQHHGVSLELGTQTIITRENASPSNPNSGPGRRQGGKPCFSCDPFELIVASARLAPGPVRGGGVRAAGTRLTSACVSVRPLGYYFQFSLTF